MNPRTGTAPRENESSASPGSGSGAVRPPLRTNLRWTLVSSAASAAANWLLIVVLARTTGSVAVGSYAYALALTAPLLGSGSLTAFQLRTLVASDPTGRYGFHEYRWASLFGDLIGIFAVCTVFLASATSRGSWTVVVPVVVMRALETLGEAYFGLWQVHERMKVLAIARVLQGIVAVTFAAAATYMGAGAMGTAIAGALGSASSLLCLHFAMTKDPQVRAAAHRDRRRFSPVRVWRIMMEGLPLGVVVLLGVLQVNIPRYFLEHAAGRAALGFFAAASQLTTAGNMIVAALAAAALPRLASWHAARNPLYWRTARKLVLGSFALGGSGFALSLLLGREILVLLYGREFAYAYHSLVVLSVAATLGFVSSALGLALTSARIVAPQNVVLVATLGVLIAASAWLVPRFGDAGAAWALVVATSVQVTGYGATLARMRSAHHARLAQL